jgi:hypothetical protein
MWKETCDPPLKLMKVSGHATLIKALQPFCRAAVIVLLISELPRPARAQLLDHFNPLSGTSNGIHLYGVSVSSMYSSGAGVTSDLGIPIGPQLSSGTSLTTIQTSASLGVVRNIGKSSFTMNYSPSYVRSLQGTSFDSINHVLGISLARGVGTKWGVGGSMSVVMSNFDQLLFGGSQGTAITSTPATFDEFAAAVLTGRSVNVALMQAVNVAPNAGSPELAYMYGGRMLSASASASVSYAASTRSAITMSVSTGRTQFISSGSNGVRRGFTTPWTTNAAPSFSWGYSLSPRTSVSVNVGTNRTISQHQDAFATQTGVSIGRTMSNRWLLQGSVGTGWIKPLRQTLPLNQKPQLTYGGSIGYKFYAQTFVGSFSRSVSDIYGLGANTSDSSSAAWSWKRPGSSLSLTGSFGYSILRSPAFANTGSWTGLIGAGKALNAQMAISGGFSYVQFPTSIVLNTSNMTRSGVSVSLSWSPSARR